MRVSHELERRASFLDATEALFRSKPLQWIPWSELAKVGGALAWRSRCAECRTERGMRIEWNRNVRESAYRFVPHEPIGRDSTQPTPALPLFEAGDPESGPWSR